MARTGRPRTSLGGAPRLSRSFGEGFAISSSKSSLPHMQKHFATNQLNSLFLCWGFFLLFGVVSSLPPQSVTGGFGVDESSWRGPQLTVEPPSRLEFSNSSGGRLHCAASGNPPPTLHWVLASAAASAPAPAPASSGDYGYGSGGVLAPAAAVGDVAGVRRVLRNGTLLFPPFPPAAFRHDVHGAVYRCLASNAAGRVLSRDAHVRAVVTQGYNVEAKSVGGGAGGAEAGVPRGCSARLRCAIPSHVREWVRVVAWVREPSSLYIYPSLHGDGKFHVLPQGDLLVFNVDFSDHFHTFRCRTIHRLTRQVVVSSPATIQVTDYRGVVPPVIVDHTPVVHVAPEEGAVLMCLAQGCPVPDIRWYRLPGREGGPPIPIGGSSGSSGWGGGGRIRAGGLLLAVEAARPEDAGTFRCSAANAGGEAGAEARLVVDSPPPRPDLSPPSRTANLGESAEFRCTLAGSSPSSGVSVSWLKDGRPLDGSATTSATTSASSGGGGGELVSVLRVPRVQREDRGMYQCVVRTDKGTVAQATAELRLGDAPPVLAYSFIEQTLQPGPAVSLKCSASGTPTPQLGWTLDGFPLPTNGRFVIGQYVTVHGDVISHVNISNVLVEDGGEYTCTAQNRAGRSSHSARLNVYGLPYIRPIPKVTAVAGERLVLKCPVAGYPIEEIRWERGNRELPVDLRQKVYPNGTLSVEHVQKKTDAGVYTCTARNKQGHSARRSGEVTVIVPPIIEPFSFQEGLSEGMRSRTVCGVSQGDPPLTITWLKDGLPLFGGVVGSGSSPSPSSSLPLSSTLLPGVSAWPLDPYSSLLNISSLSSSHSGEYTCVASNRAAEVRFKARLQVKVPPRWLVEPEDTSVARNKNVVLQCQADGVPKPTIVWKKATGGKSGDYQEIRSYLPSSGSSSSSSSLSYPYLSSSLPVAPSMRILENGSLLIQHAREEQEGFYLCQANNGVGTGVGKVVHLKVNSAPYFPSQTQPITVRKGDVATLHCEVGGNQPISILWLKGLDVLNPSSNYRHSVKQETSPVTSGQMTSSSLQIANIEGSDGGRYTCQASNAFGRDQQVIQLIVQEPPPSPTRPEAASIGSRYVDLKWKQGEPSAATMNARDQGAISLEGTEVHKFILQYKETSEPWSSAIEIEIPVGGSDSNTGQSSHHGWQPPQGPWSPVSTNSGLGQWYHKRIDSLRPATRYSFRVASEGAGGRGTYGDVLEVRTEPQRPSAPPRNAILHPLSSTSLRLSWNAPPIDAWHGDVHAYTVGIRDASSGSTHYNFSTYPVEDVEDDSDDDLDNDRKAGGRGIGLDIGPETTWEANLRQPQYEQHLTAGSGYHFSLILSGLRPFSRYAAVVQAVNQVGAGPLSEPAEAQTLEDVPSMPPQDVRCAALTPQSLQVSWQPPPSAHAHGIIRGYKLTYEPADEVLVGEDIWETKKTTALTTVLSGLQRFSNYSLRVAAFTGVGDGVAAPPIHCRTDEDVPGPPADIKVVVSSPQSLLVSWLPPKEPNGIITKYNLYNRVVDGSGVIGRGMGDSALGAPVGAGGQQGKRSLPGTHTSFEAKGLAPRVEHSFWVTATTRAGEGRSTRVASLMPTPRVPARIYSFGGQVIKPWRSHVSLPCLAVGSPPPSSSSGHLPRAWFMDSVPIQSTMSFSSGSSDYSSDSAIIGHGRFRVESSGALTIRDLHRSVAANYTCRVENADGADSIYYSLIVQVPPSAPSVYVTSTTTSSIVVHWKTGDTGAAPLTGFTLNYRRNHGEWEEAQILRHSTSYQLKGLSCGTSYHLYLTAHNRVGSSPASTSLVARTQGEVPGTPSYSPSSSLITSSSKAFLSANSTAVRIRLRLWPDGGCSILYFVIENRPINQHQWNLVSNDVKPGRRYTLYGLNPATVYRLRITAHNMAGSSTAEFTFVTLTKDGVSPSPELVRLAGGIGIDGTGGGKRSLLTDVRVVAPLAVSTMALLGAGAAACLCWKNKSSSSVEENSQCLSSKGGAGTSTLSTSATMDNKQNAETQIREQQQHSACGAAEQAYYATIHKVALAAASSSATVDKIPETSEDISPYATFHLGDAGAGNMPTGAAPGHAHLPPSVLPCSNTLLHSFIYHEQPLTEGCASPPHRTPASHRRREGKGASSSGAASVLTSGGSEGFHSPDSLDSDPDQLTSSRTESSIQLECGAVVEGGREGVCRVGGAQGRSRNSECGAGSGGEHRRRRGGSGGGGQSYIYHGGQSSTSSDISPMAEQKSLPRRGRPKWLAPSKALSPWGHHAGGQQQTQHHLPPPPPPVPPSPCYSQQLNQRDDNSSGSVNTSLSGERLELSEAECDIDTLKKLKLGLRSSLWSRPSGGGGNGGGGVASSAPSQDFSIAV